MDGGGGGLGLTAGFATSVLAIAICSVSLEESERSGDARLPAKPASFAEGRRVQNRRAVPQNLNSLSQGRPT